LKNELLGVYMIGGYWDKSAGGNPPEPQPVIRIIHGKQDEEAPK